MSTRALNSKIEVYLDTSKEWRWKVTHANGNVIGASSEGYKNKSDCLNNLKSLGEQITAWVSSESLKDAIMNMPKTKGI